MSRKVGEMGSFTRIIRRMLTQTATLKVHYELKHNAIASGDTWTHR
jgi:hypothetical protein